MFTVSDILGKAGTLLVSAYFETGKGFVEQNWELLLAILERVRWLGIPFIIGADFQNHPQDNPRHPSLFT